MTNERLLAWAQAQTRLELDAETPNGELYWRAHNATARALRGLEERVRELGLDVDPKRSGSRRLEQHVRQRYGSGGDA